MLTPAANTSANRRTNNTQKPVENRKNSNLNKNQEPGVGSITDERLEEIKIEHYNRKMGNGSS